MIRTLMAATAATTLAMVGPAVAQGLTDMTAAERQSFRAEVRQYLLENPEVLMEAIAILEQRQADEQAQADVAILESNSADLYEFAGDWVGGNPDGDVTLVEFLDYRCGFCRRAHPEVVELIESDGNIRLIVKEFPILGEASVLSSRFAIAVRQVAGDDAYKAAHDILIALRGNPDESTLRGIAEELGADPDDVFVQMESPDVDAVIAQNRALAQRLQINGTPSFVLGDQLLRGYLPLAAMQDIVTELRNDG